MFIMLDGIDGSGKSTVLAAWKKYLLDAGRPVFDLNTYWSEHGDYPTDQTFAPGDVVLTAEPTTVGVGRVIRTELIKAGTAYPARAIAEAYSLDRLVLYQKVIIPALARGALVLQDRGVSTSLCYQALGGQLLPAFLEDLSGNALALAHRPDHLVLLAADPEIARQRLVARREKYDNVIFERLDFQRRAAERFASPEYQAIFTTRGTRVHQLPANSEIGILRQTAVDLLKIFLA